MKIVYGAAAKEDLLKIRRYIRENLHNPDAAARVIKSITDDIARLKTSPYAGVEYEKRTGIRRDARILISGRYWVIYRVTAQIIILQVADTRQDFLRILGSFPEH